MQLTSTAKCPLLSELVCLSSESSCCQLSDDVDYSTHAVFTVKPQNHAGGLFGLHCLWFNKLMGFCHT